MYNEERGVDACVRRVCSVLATIAYPSRLVAVNDGSRDQTGAILDRLGPQFPKLTVIHHDRNSGYGAALRSGMRHAAEAGFDYALFMDADLTNDPADIPRFVNKMKDGYDVIKATRYSDGGAVRGVPGYRVVVSRVGNSIARHLYGLPITDCTNGFRAVHTRLLSQMELQEPRFPIIMEELYYCKFLTNRFAQIPVTLTDRGKDRRATSFVYGPRVFYDYLKYPCKSFLGVRPQLRAADKDK
jgi:glycosyltransferase involved in cell wall biosynthesis